MTVNTGVTTVDEAREAAERINTMLADGRKQEAYAAALALRESLRASVASHPELLENLQMTEEAIKQFEAAGLKAPKERAAPTTRVSALNQPVPPGLKRALVAIVVCVALGLVGMGVKRWMDQSARKAAYAAYKQAAAPVVEELEKISAATDTGISYTRYSEKIGDANFHFQKFEEVYGDSGTMSSDVKYPSRRKLLVAIASYRDALRAWKTEIDADDYDTRTEAKRLIQECWRDGDKSLAQAKALLADGQ